MKNVSHRETYYPVTCTYKKWLSHRDTEEQPFPCLLLGRADYLATINVLLSLLVGETKGPQNLIL